MELCVFWGGHKSSYSVLFKWTEPFKVVNKMHDGTIVCRECYLERVGGRLFDRITDKCVCNLTLR